MNGKSTSYGGFLGEIAARFQRRFDEIVVVENFDSGPEFEIALCEVLRKVLPRRVGVCRGYVVDRTGEQQGDDIIVFDAARFPTLRSLGDDLSKKEHVPADAVLAYIEAKHTLYLEPTKKSEGQSLTKAVSQVAAVKSLSRTAVEISEVVPGVKLAGPITLTRDAPGWPNKLNPWYGMIFARHLVTKSAQPRLALVEALATLAAALEGADPAQRVRLHQARAFILQEDLAASLDAVDAALAHASDDETRCLLRYQRGTIHLRAAHLPLALGDFTFAAEHSQIASTSQSALLARALAHARAGDDDDAAADCGRVIARESETPRLAVMARQERGRIYADSGRCEDALADWAAALALADAADEQRFRILERRQALFERLGDTARAASDAEALASYRSVSTAYRSELRDSAATLRTRR